MAEVTAIRNNVLPYPVYGLPYTVVIPIFDADGDLVSGAASLDSEISKNGDTFADCTNEATEIATSSGMYYLALTATEMTADIASIIVKTSTSGAKTTPMNLYPTHLPQLRAATAQGGAAGYITLDSSASALDDFYNGCVVYIYGGTGSSQARVITDYTGSNKQASVTPEWATNPSSDSTFYIYHTHMAVNAVMSNSSNVTAWNGTAIPGVDTAGYPKVTIKDGTGTGELDTTSGKVDINNKTGFSLADGSITSTVIATDAIDADSLAADAVDEIVADILTTPANKLTTDLSGYVTVADKTGFRLSSTGVDDILDEVVEGTLTLRHIVKIVLSVLAGKTTGGGTTSVYFRDSADSKNRVAATVDSNGNRSSVTLDGA